MEANLPGGLGFLQVYIDALEPTNISAGRGMGTSNICVPTTSLVFHGAFMDIPVSWSGGRIPDSFNITIVSVDPTGVSTVPIPPPVLIDGIFIQMTYDEEPEVENIPPWSNTVSHE